MLVQQVLQLMRSEVHLQQQGDGRNAAKPQHRSAGSDFQVIALHSAPNLGQASQEIRLPASLQER